MPNPINFDDLRRAAKRRLPKIAFDFIEGGVDGEDGIVRNETAFGRHLLVPRYGVDVSDVDPGVTLFGQRYAQPWGIAPTGAIGLFRPGGDGMLARAAGAAGVPFVLSGMATATIEAIAPLAPGHVWFQLYLAKDRSISWDMLTRAKAAGVSTLLVTVDIPGHAKRERNLRNGFAAARPLAPSLRAQIETLRHPRWLAGYLRAPALTASMWERYVPGERSGPPTLAFVGSQMPSPATWDDIAEIRRRWSGALVVKGLMHPADAVRAANLGVDGVLVSNHGGRQLDRSAAPIDMLPRVRDAVGGRLTLLYDSGIRRGADIVTALAMGASMCLVGRWTLYAVAADGERGAQAAVGMISDEVRSVMTQVGARDVGALGPDILFDADRGANAR
jgi:L-lactate dehydrogenase (cytochrome)/(S)-mandelate dehydrogenase